MGVFAGLDWGSQKHAVCVVDQCGGVLERFEIEHDEDGIGELRKRLAVHGAGVPIAIERPSGLLVDTLVDAGHRVVPIHPNIVKACRPRYRAAGGKSDSTDAYLLADVLRTDGHRFRPLTPPSDALKALRATVRTRSDLVGHRVALTNQLRSLLDTFWPGPLHLFKDLFSTISLTFLQAYPTPQSAESLTEKRLAAFLKRKRYSGHQPAAKLLQRLREAPAGHAGTAEAEAKGSLVRTVAHLLEELGEQIAKLDSTIEEAIASIPDGRIVTSFPRAGRINAAQILAELGDVRERYQSDQHLAAEAGVCPITYQSGRSRGVSCRWACNKRLRAAVVIWADNSRHSSPWANDVYTRARSRGCAHAHAVRILARAWIRVLWRSWTDRTPYDPARHRAAQKFAA